MSNGAVIQPPALGFARRHTDMFTTLTIVFGMCIASIGGYRSLDHFCTGPFSPLFRHPEFQPLTSREIGFFITAIVITALVMAPILVLKNRSLWFLVLAAVPFGWLAFMIIRDKARVYRYGLSVRKQQVLCWLGLVVVGILSLVAVNWDVPVTRTIPVSSIEITDEWIYVKNFEDAPVIIHLFGQYHFFTIIIGPLLLYGALLQETVVSPKFRREGQFLVRA